MVHFYSNIWSHCGPLILTKTVAPYWTTFGKNHYKLWSNWGPLCWAKTLASYWANFEKWAIFHYKLWSHWGPLNWAKSTSFWGPLHQKGETCSLFFNCLLRPVTAKQLQQQQQEREERERRGRERRGRRGLCCIEEVKNIFWAQKHFWNRHCQPRKLVSVNRVKIRVFCYCCIM